MDIRRIESRKNEYIRHLRKLGKSRSYRELHREFLCDGRSLLADALQAGAVITSILWKEGQSEGQAVIEESEMSGRHELPVPLRKSGILRQYAAPSDLFDYVSSLENSPGPVFTVRMSGREERPAGSAIILEDVQDPGNVGTVLRTAAALGIDAVVLCGDCADIYNPKTVRSTMGAVFRQYVHHCGDPAEFVRKNGLKLYGAALTEDAKDLREVLLKDAAVCIGNEGHGLSRSLLESCEERLIIPMMPGAESLNAAVAASIIMWEMIR